MAIANVRPGFSTLDQSIRTLMEKGATTMKRLFLELGGKSAAIVLDDADLEAASMIGFGVTVTRCARDQATHAAGRRGQPGSIPLAISRPR